MTRRTTVRGIFKGLRRHSLVAIHEPVTVVIPTNVKGKRQTERHILCQCDCGEETTTRFIQWYNGTTKTCKKCRYKKRRKKGAPVQKGEATIDASAALFVGIEREPDDEDDALDEG